MFKLPANWLTSRAKVAGHVAANFANHNYLWSCGRFKLAG